MLCYSMNLPQTMSPSLLPDEDTKAAARAKLDRVISRITVVLVLLLSVASFALSFEALSDLGARSGAIPSSKAWIFPLLIDGAIIIFSTAALRASIFGRVDRWSLSLVVVTTVASITLNIAHAHATVSSCLVAAMPPLLLGLSYESLLRQLASNLSVPAVVPSGKTHSRPRKAIRGPAQAPAATTAAPGTKKEHALKLLAEGMSKRAVARELQMAPSTIRRIAGASAPQPAT